MSSSREIAFFAIAGAYTLALALCAGADSPMSGRK